MNDNNPGSSTLSCVQREEVSNGDLCICDDPQKGKFGVGVYDLGWNNCECDDILVADFSLQRVLEPGDDINVECDVPKYMTNSGARFIAKEGCMTDVDISEISKLTGFEVFDKIKSFKMEYE